VLTEVTALRRRRKFEIDGGNIMQPKIRDWEHWNDPKLVSSMDELWRRDIFQVHRQKVRDVLSSLFSRDPECRTVLEFGSGTGNYVPMVRELGREYVGVDVTEAMREIA
jgi:SAM-dependent methyltransferase